MNQPAPADRQFGAVPQRLELRRTPKACADDDEIARYHLRATVAPLDLGIGGVAARPIRRDRNRETARGDTRGVNVAIECAIRADNNQVQQRFVMRD